MIVLRGKYIIHVFPGFIAKIWDLRMQLWRCFTEEFPTADLAIKAADQWIQSKEDSRSSKKK